MQNYSDFAEYIKSGQYFEDARRWYLYKYVIIFIQRSQAAIILFSTFFVVISIAFTATKMFPIKMRKDYVISFEDAFSKSAHIIQANGITNNPIASMADIMVKNYIMQREKYSYPQRKQQIIYIKNNSSKIIFRNFYNFMNIDNPSSPIIRFQKEAKKHVSILSAEYPSKNIGLIKFQTVAKDISGAILEDIIWQAKINFEIDEINPNLPTNTRYNFIVTEYSLKLLKTNKIQQTANQEGVNN